MPDWFKFLPDREYRETFEVPKFEEKVEPSQSILARAFERYRQAAELRDQQEQATWEPDPMALFRQVEQEQQPQSTQQAVAEFERATSLEASRQRFRQVEQDLQPSIAEFESAVPTAAQVTAGFQTGADRLRERVGGLGIERLAAEREETPYERRRSLGQVPAEARAGFAYEPETVAARERLTENLRESHPDWSEEQLHSAATSALEPGEGFMEAAAWGLAMRPALAAMAARGGEAAAPAARSAVAEFERAVPKARDWGRRLLTEETGGGELPAWRQAERGVRGMGTAEEMGAPTMRGAGRVPPRKPPVTAEGTPPGGGVPERGWSEAQRILDVKEETLLKPGKVTQIPLVRRGLGALNPSVSAERRVVVSYNSRAATTASLETKWTATRQPLIQELETAWKESAPRYIGPADRSAAVRNTLLDYGQNPGDYANVSPRLRQAADQYKAYQDTVLTEARGQFGVDIRPYPVKEGGFFVPNVATRESLEGAANKLSASYTSASTSSKFGTARGRLYESAAQRMSHDPKFIPETDIRTLADLHDAALGRMAGNETFKLGVGGKTRLEVLQETHPQLANQMIGLRQRLQSLRGTAGRLDSRLKGTIDDFLASPDEMALSDLSEGLNVKVRADAVGRMGPNFGKTARELNAEILAVRQEIRRLRPAWEGANIDPYVMNHKTYRYYTSEESAAIDKVLTTRLPIGQGIVDVIDEMRVTAFGGDISPLTIQGLLGSAADPITLARNGRGIVRELATGNRLTALAREEPELVARFNVATGRPLGQMGAEFRQYGRGPERIPGIGKAWALINDRTMQTVEYFRYQAWKNDTALLQKMNPGMSQAVADAEAANAWSKIMPALSTTERGTSVLQAKLERMPVISTSFLGAPPTFIKDAASGIAKLGASRELSAVARWQGLAGREQLAVLRLTMMTGTLATLSTASYIIAGYSPEEAAKTALDPTRGRFVSIATGKEGYIPIGGPMRSFIRALAPRNVDGNLVPFAATLQFLRGKETPNLAAATDLVRNKDFLGRTIVTGDFPQNLLSGLWYAAERHMPLTPGSVSEKIRSGEKEPTDIGALAREAATQLGGVSFYETSPWEKRNEARDRAAQQMFGRNWADLNRGEQNDVREANPDLRKAEELATTIGAEREQKYSQRTEAYNAAKNERGDEGVRALESDPTGREWVSWRKTVGSELNTVYETLTEQLGIEDEPQDSEFIEDRLAERYWNLELDTNNDGLISNEEYRAYDAAREAILREARTAAVSDEYILHGYRGQMWPNHPQLQAIEEEYQQAKEIAHEYYSIPTKIGMAAEKQDRAARNAEIAQAIATQQNKPFLVALLEMGLSATEQDEAFIYSKLPANPKRKMYRYDNPEKWELFKRFYSDVPLSMAIEEPELEVVGATP